jgi:uncharacterized membrane protein
MKCNSLSAWFPENFVAILTLLQNIQTKLSNHTVTLYEFQDNIGNLAEEFVKMTQKYENTRDQMTVQTHSILREQIVKMNGHGSVLLSSFMLAIIFAPTTAAGHSVFKKNITYLLNFWQGQAATGVCCD